MKQTHAIKKPLKKKSAHYRAGVSAYFKRETTKRQNHTADTLKAHLITPSAAAF